MIKFSIDLLKRQEIDLTGEEPPTFLNDANSEILSFHDSIKYTLHISLKESGILVGGSVSTKVNALCGRCLKPLKLTIANNNLCFFVNTTESLDCDISEQIRTELLICLPMNFLCKNDCLGLCPQCGVDRNQTACNCANSFEDTPNPWTELDNL